MCIRDSHNADQRVAGQLVPHLERTGRVLHLHGFAAVSYTHLDVYKRQIYKGRVTRLMNFGAFVEIAPGKEGLVHISKRCV